MSHSFGFVSTHANVSVTQVGLQGVRIAFLEKEGHKRPAQGDLDFAVEPTERGFVVTVLLKETPAGMRK